MCFSLTLNASRFTATDFAQSTVTNRSDAHSVNVGVNSHGDMPEASSTEKIERVTSLFS